MTKSKHTKKALLMSVLSMLMCMAMLVGSTFAWFTDSVTSGNNKIVAGNLDVELEYAVLNEDGSFKEWKTVDSETALFKDELWEPGHTEVAYLKISNAGSLSLNYRLAIDAKDTVIGKGYDKDEKKEYDIRLSEFLKFGAVETGAENFYATRAEALAAVAENAKYLKSNSITGSIKASEKETDIKYIALVVYMPGAETGNAANHYKNFAPEVELGIMLEAHQMVDEKDSFGENYDAEAWQDDELDLTAENIVVSNLSQLQTIVNAVNKDSNSFENQTITLGENIDLSSVENWTPIGTMTSPFKGTFDGNNKTVSGLKINKDENEKAGFFGVIEDAAIKNLTVGGEITITESNEFAQLTIGGICGIGIRATVENCTNRVKINVSAEMAYDVRVGGIVGGVSESAVFTNCTNDADLTATNGDNDNTMVGGITSMVYPTAMEVTFTNSENNGTLIGTATNDQAVQL